MTDQNLFHEPVLKSEILALLLFDKVRTVFDGTLGLGGHAEAILSTFPGIKKYIACDLDSQNLSFAQKKLGTWHQKTIFHHSNFSAIKQIIQTSDIPRPLVILLDLGLCSTHIDDPKKGFSFSADGPLRMTFNPEEERDCAQILNMEAEKELERVLREYGEEPLARKLAAKIIERRKQKFFATTADLRSLVEENVSPIHRKKTLMRVFQAFRIAVNNELEVLEETLRKAAEVMKSGDRCGVISYHSLEDRIVKQFFLVSSRPQTMETPQSLHTEIAPAEFRLLTKKPVVPSDSEITRNPRSRSACLRILEKI